MIAGSPPAPTRAGDLARRDVRWAESRGELVERRVASMRPSRRATVHELRGTAPDPCFARSVLVHDD